MRIGVVFPQTQIGADVGAIRAYVQAAEDLGYQHLMVYDHVLGADPAAREGWSGAYDLHDTFHEPFVLFGWLAAFSSLELVTGVIVLPQRQAALAAKQAAEVDILSGGKLRLGVGIGWNKVEYEALGEDFHRRGRVLDEQIDLMKRLWTEPVVTSSGSRHHVEAAGLAPMPVQRPIPIWLGAEHAEKAFDRVGRVGDGWFPQVAPGAKLDELIGRVHAAAARHGRDPAAIGMEGRISVRAGELDRVAAEADGWRKASATHVSVNTMPGGRKSVDEHIALIREAASAVGL
jgi:probable F420-dependent oxidoreductase